MSTQATWSDTMTASLLQTSSATTPNIVFVYVQDADDPDGDDVKTFTMDTVAATRLRDSLNLTLTKAGEA